MKKLTSLCSVLWLLSSFLAPAGSAQSVKPGTQIQVQLLDPLDTGKAQVGDEFSASLAERVHVEGDLFWPKGTQVRGRVVDVVSSGRLSRPASITLQLVQIGDSPIDTEIEKIDGNSHAGRNVALIGGGATVGAILGAIAGGGKGAAIGAAAGAGAGTATAAATGKQEIVLRAETPLAFVIAGEGARQPEVSGPVHESDTAAQPDVPRYDSQYYEPYAPEQLDNLLAPIALYPDPLLAQVLLAATFPDQIQDAARWAPAGSPNNIDYRPWDVSVKAVAHYPTVLAMLNDRLDWTTALGQAYVYQSSDIMQSVQRLRNLAYSQGNLISTPQQQLIMDRGYIQIVPAQPRVIFVPVYDSEAIYSRRVYRPFFGFGSFYSFGTGYAIGAWLNYDLDWGSHRVVYYGWDRRGDGWRERSRPYVQVTNVYVNNRYEQVNVNHNVVDRHVDYDNVKRYNTVHHDVSYENRARIESDRARNEPSRDHQEPRLEPANERFDNRGHENDRGNDWVNDRGNDRDRRDQSSFQGRPTPPQVPSDTKFERTNQTPVTVEQPHSEPANGKVNDRGNDRGLRNQPSATPEQPARTAPQSLQAAPAAPPSAQVAVRQPSQDQPKATQQQQQQRQRGDKDDKNDKNDKSKDNGKDKKQ